MPFPTTSIISNFTGADESPISEGGIWTSTGGGLVGGANAQRFSNQFGTSSDIGAFEMRTTATYGPQAEAYITVANSDAEFIQLWVLLTFSPQNGYRLDISTGGVWGLWKHVAGVESQLGADLGTQAISDNDSIGIEYTGGVVRAYYKAAAGSWGQVGTDRADTSLQSNTGSIAIASNHLQKFDDLGGGTVGGGGPPQSSYVLGYRLF